MNPKVNVAFFTYNNIDHPTLLIRGNRTYSFEPSDIKDINVEQLPDSAGMRYTLHLALSDAEYTMQFDLPGDTAERCPPLNSRNTAIFRLRKLRKFRCLKSNEIRFLLTYSSATIL